jgi:hypothetical protein
MLLSHALQILGFVDGPAFGAADPNSLFMTLDLRES